MQQEPLARGGEEVEGTKHLEGGQGGGEIQGAHLDEDVVLRLGALPAGPVMVSARLPVLGRVHRQPAPQVPIDSH